MFKKVEEKAQADIQRVIDKMQALAITTGYTFEGRPIQKYIAPVCGEALAGAIVGVSVVAASPSVPFSGALHKQADGIDGARYAALEQVLDKAEALGANALIALDYQYVCVDKNGLLVMVSATAVTV